MPYVLYLIVGVSIQILMDMIYVDDVLKAVLTSFITQLAMLIVLIFILVKEGTITKMFTVSRLRIKEYLIAFLVGAVISIVITKVVLYTGFFIDESFVNANIQYEYNIVVTIITSVFLAPFMEEILFRGMMFEKMKSHFGMISAAIISSLFFAIGHASFLQLICGFILGLFLCYVYEYKKSLVMAIIVHIAYNATTIILNIL